MITGQQVTQLATNGRSVFSLEALTPGASSIQSDFMVPTSSSSDFNVSFNGQRVSHNLWLVDGGEAADRGGGGGADVLPSEDAIAEFRTMTSNYSAEYGLSSAGTVSMVIKSGTKQLHATGYYFGRNDALDAQNYFHRRELRLGAALQRLWIQCRRAGFVPPNQPQDFLLLQHGMAALHPGGTVHPNRAFGEHVS